MAFVFVATADIARDAADGASQTVHAHGLPVIVDAAAQLPPRDNLRRFIAAGADLVLFSGGKAIGGPQSSGILAGRRDLIGSALVQMMDMDVHPQTWSASPLIDRSALRGIPHHGIGRGFKVGKEEIAGLLTALALFTARDEAAFAARPAPASAGHRRCAGRQRARPDGPTRCSAATAAIPTLELQVQRRRRRH